MIVEMMGFLIFLGVAILLFVRYQEGRGEKKVDTDEFKVSVESLQREIDKASTEAIERMGSQVNRFERLMKDAKTSDEDLKYRMSEIRALEDRLRKEIAESRALTETLKMERERTKDLRDELQRQAALTSQIINSNAQVESSMINVTSRNAINAINAYEETSVLPDIADADIIEEEPKTTNNFAALLTESIEKEEERERMSYEPQREVFEMSAEAKEMMNKDDTAKEQIDEYNNYDNVNDKARNNEETGEYDEGDIKEGTNEEGKETPSDVAKRLLNAGVDVEEVMRQTGMGRGAVELLAQMIGRK